LLEGCVAVFFKDAVVDDAGFADEGFVDGGFVDEGLGGRVDADDDGRSREFAGRAACSGALSVVGIVGAHGGGGWSGGVLSSLASAPSSRAALERRRRADASGRVQSNGGRGSGGGGGDCAVAECCGRCDDALAPCVVVTEFVVRPAADDPGRIGRLGDGGGCLLTLARVEGYLAGTSARMQHT
jgi:hypothetical protein